VSVRKAGLRTTTAGVASQVVGLGIDGWLHARDPHLAEREGVFSLTNIGHVLFMSGLALVVLGVLLALVGPRLYAHRDSPTPCGLRMARLVAPVAALALIGGGVAGASASGLAAGHHHDDHQAAADHHSGVSGDSGETGHAHGGARGGAGHDNGTAALDLQHAHEGGDVPADLGAVFAGADLSGGAASHQHDPAAHELDPGPFPSDPPASHDHGAPPPAPGGGHDHGTVPPPDPGTQAPLDAQLAVARQFALQHPTAASAVAAGYQQVTAYIPGIAAHYLRVGQVDGLFDPAQPEFLLYGRNGQLVGVAYYAVGAAPPAGFAGGADMWHQHLDLCIDPHTLMVIGGERTPPDQCAARGGVILGGQDRWLLHAWVVPGWESSEGVFSHTNSRLT